MKKSKIEIIMYMQWVFILILLVGWCMNIYDIMGYDFGQGQNKEIVLRFIGVIIFPLGSFMGIMY